MYNVQGQYQKFVRAVEAVKEGSWGPEDMKKFLERSWAILKPKGDQIFEVLATEGYRDDAEEECLSAEGGVEHYEEGMTQMGAYLQDGNLKHLETGLKTIKKGNDLLNKAMNLNRDSYEEMEITFFV